MDNSIKRIRSPLKYVGSKYRLIPHIWGLIPDGITEMVSPFFGGGSLELNLSYYLGIKVYAYDIDPYVVAFWRYFLDDPKSIIHDAKRLCFRYTLSELKQINKDIFGSEEPEAESYDLAVYLYLFSRLSFSSRFGGGVIDYEVCGDDVFRKLKGIRDANAFPDTDWEYAKNVDIEIVESDFKESLKNHPDIFCYLDPPYLGIESIYGKVKRVFDHHTLSLILHKREYWIGSYGHFPEVPYIKLAYDGFRIIEIPFKTSWHNSRQKYNQVELLVCSHDIKDPQMTLF